MNQLYMYLCHTGDGGGLLVKEALGVQQILHRNSRFVGGPEKTVINWGSSQLPPEVLKCRVINTNLAVSRSIDKLASFNCFARDGIRHVPYTTDRQIAIRWLGDGHKVVCRGTTTGRGGEGISLIAPDALNLPVQSDLRALWGWVASFLDGSQRSNLAALQGSRLFTKFIPYTREYRVHVVGGQVINVRRKIIDEGTLARQELALLHTIGDFYSVSIYPDDVATQAIAATRAVGLDFAGVDVLWDGRRAWVLETNTAPGIGGITVQRYADALRRLSENAL